MSVSGVGSTYNSSGYYGNATTTINNMFENNNNNNNSSSSSNQVSMSPTLDDLSSLAEYAVLAMDAMGVDSSGRVTFNQITAYKKDLEKEFADQMKADFKKLGIPEDAEFTITIDKDGAIKIDGDDPNIAEIQKYFLDNPEMGSKYKEIKLLQDLDGARKALDVNPAELRSRIQVESMAAWWGSSGQSSSMLGNFSGGELAMYQGVNKMV